MAFTNLTSLVPGKPGGNSNSGGGGKKYDDSVTNNPSEANWKTAPAYIFKILEGDKASGVLENTLDSVSITPQEITQDEVFAIEVTPTFRGVLIESQGLLLKDITISGTTGIQSNRGAGVDPTTGRSFGGEFLGVGTSGDSTASGYYKFHTLRSFFRGYASMKKKLPREREMRIAFDNWKDDEHLWVEPVKFTMRRSSTRPMMYDYIIVLKSVGTVIATPGGYGVANNSFFGSLQDKVGKITSYLKKGTAIYKNNLNTIKKFQRNIENALVNPVDGVNEALSTIGGTTNQITSLPGVAQSGAQSGAQEIGSLFSSPKQASAAIGGGAGSAGQASIGAGGAGAQASGAGAAPVVSSMMTKNVNSRVLNDFGITRESVQKLLDTSIAVEEDYNDYLGKDMTKYNDYKNRTPTVQPAGSVGGISSGRIPTLQEQIGLNGAANIRRGLMELLGMGNEIFKRDIYDNQETFFNKIENPEKVFVESAPSSREAVVQSGDNIQIFALRETGSLDKFRNIVLLNKLKPPYKVFPGQILAVPTNIQNIKNYNSSTNKNWNINKDLNSTELSMGVDLKLTDTNDILIAPNGDLDMIAATDNLSQALLLKLEYDPYSLKRHPEIGAGLPEYLGRKTQNTDEIVRKVRETLTSDTRVETVDSLEVKINNNIITINAAVSVVGSNKRIPLKLQIN